MVYCLFFCFKEIYHVNVVGIHAQIGYSHLQFTVDLMYLKQQVQLNECFINFEEIVCVNEAQ